MDAHLSASQPGSDLRLLVDVEAQVAGQIARLLGRGRCTEYVDEMELASRNAHDEASGLIECRAVGIREVEADDDGELRGAGVLGGGAHGDDDMTMHASVEAQSSTRRLSQNGLAKRALAPVRGYDRLGTSCASPRT